MTGVSIRIAIDGGEEALRTLRQAAERVERPRDLWDAIGLSLVTSTQTRFERGHDPDGNPWPPSIRVQLEGGKTLVDSARLMQSITHIADDDGVSVGSNAIYAAVHQLGAVITPVNAPKLVFRLGGELKFVDRVEIPARPFLGIDHDDEVEMINIAEDWLRDMLPGGDADAR